jgi:hypothetical protein
MAIEPHSTLDDDFKEIGEFGLYQFVIVFLVGLTAVQLAVLDYRCFFIGATPDYRFMKEFKLDSLIAKD